MNEYLLSLLFSLNGTATFVVIVGLLVLAGNWLMRTLETTGYGAQAESTITKPPRWVWALVAIAMLVATVTPSREQYLTALAATHGPAAVQNLIEALKDSK